jgi:serine/threonine-protein kinase
VSSASSSDRYRLLGCLGRGGMAEVHLAKTTGPGGFERLVVVKRPLEHLRSDPSYRRMFLDEARIVARIRHRNVVQVHDLHSTADDLWLVMEFLEGETVATFLSEARRFDPFVGAYIAYEAANGLHAAHELQVNGRPCNLVHRDVSPQNLFVTYSGEVKLLDFGIARHDDRETHTAHGVVKGNLPYMSPEQLTGEPLDRRSDLFSLGSVLFELATGIGLFHRRTHVDVIRCVCFADIPRPSDYRPDLPRGFDEICARALSRDPETRYRTAGEMARDLDALLTQAGGAAVLRDRLTGLMEQHFDERRKQKRVLVESPQRTERLAFDVAFPRAGQPLPVPHLSLPEPAGPITATVVRHRPSRIRNVALGAVALLVAIAGGIGLGFAWHSGAGRATASVRAVAAEIAAPIPIAPALTEAAPVAPIEAVEVLPPHETNAVASNEPAIETLEAVPSESAVEEQEAASEPRARRQRRARARAHRSPFHPFD